MPTSHHAKHRESLFTRVIVGQALYWVSTALILLLVRSLGALAHPLTLIGAGLVLALSIWAYDWLMKTFDRSNEFIHEWLSWWPTSRR